MKRLLITLLAAGVLLLFLMPIWTHRPSAVKFSVGPAWPAGKVTPQIAHADDEAVLLAPDGSLWGWGGSKFEEMHLVRNAAVAKVPRRLGSGTDWRQVGLVSFQGILAVKADGSLWEGSLTNRFASPARIGTGTNWTSISCGMGHCLALQKDGSLWAWGRNDEGELGNGTTKSEPRPVQIGQDNDWKAIATGATTSFALKNDGTVWGWGPWVNVFQQSGTYDYLPGQIDSGTNWVSLWPSGPSLLALKDKGTLWLRNMSSMGVKSRYSFIQIGRDRDWQNAHAENLGLLDFFAGKRDGSQWVWGANSCNELGTGSRLYVPAPQRLPFAFDPWAFSSGYGNTALLTRDGTLWTWGIRLGVPRPSRRLLEFKKMVNELVQKIAHRQLFDIAPFKMDPVPHRLWTLPVEMRRALGRDNPTQRPQL